MKGGKWRQKEECIEGESWGSGKKYGSCFIGHGGIVQCHQSMISKYGRIYKRNYLIYRRNKMRVNVYAEEMTDRIEIIEKGGFTGLRMYMYLPVTQNEAMEDGSGQYTKKEVQIRGPFLHGENDDDSSAITFWGKQDLRVILGKALLLLNAHYDARKNEISGLQQLK
jgi:hypothetical protein